jgi:hypothetical protein
MNQKNRVITVRAAMSRSKTFANRKELEGFVAELEKTRGGVYDPLEWNAIRKLAALNGGGVPPPSDLPDPKPPTPFDERISVLEREEDEAEAAYAESKEAWFARLQELKAEAPRRHNTTKLSRFQLWLEDGQAEVRNLEFAFGKAARTLQRKRAGMNALKIQRDRFRREQECRVVYEGQEVSLAEFAALRKREVR